MEQTTIASFEPSVDNSNISVLRKFNASHRFSFIGNCAPTSLIELLNGNDFISYSNYREAAYHLQHLSWESVKFPEIIVGYYDQECKIDVARFAQFLNSHKKLSGIPFILIERDQSIKGKADYKPIPGVDDIVKNDISIEELINKIILLRKFKSLRQGRLTRIELKTNEIQADRRTLYKIDAFFKRIMDIVIATTALIILMPILAIIATIIKFDSKGPIFYASFRAGSNYRIFKFIKFRTMIAEADSKLANLKNRNQYASSDKNMPVFFKISDDPRITRFGKLLRNTSLDELPQLVNVLKGDMSLVGNRPLPLYEAKTLTTDFYAERFNAPAGITGLWQISKRGQKEMSVEERIALDIDYARHNSFTYDLKIILKTPKALIQKDNV